MVPYKYGEKSANTLIVAGFRHLTFKSFEGYFSFSFICKNKLMIRVKIDSNLLIDWGCGGAGLVITRCLKRWTRSAIGLLEGWDSREPVDNCGTVSLVKSSGDDNTG